MSKINKAIADFFSGLSDDVIEERVKEYILAELKNQRRLQDILGDSYVKNRISCEGISQILQDSEIGEAAKEEVIKTFEELKLL